MFVYFTELKVLFMTLTNQTCNQIGSDRHVFTLNQRIDWLFRKKHKQIISLLAFAGPLNLREINQVLSCGKGNSRTSKVLADLQKNDYVRLEKINRKSFKISREKSDSNSVLVWRKESNLQRYVLTEKWASDLIHFVYGQTSDHSNNVMRFLLTRFTYSDPLSHEVMLTAITTQYFSAVPEQYFFEQIGQIITLRILLHQYFGSRTYLKKTIISEFGDKSEFKRYFVTLPPASSLQKFKNWLEKIAIFTPKDGFQHESVFDLFNILVIGDLPEDDLCSHLAEFLVLFYDKKYFRLSDASNPYRTLLRILKNCIEKEVKFS